MDCPLPENWSEGPKFASRGGTPSTTPSPHWEVVLGVLHMVRWGKVRTREERCSGIVLRNLQHSRSGVPYTCCNCFACAPLVSCNERTHMFDLRRSWSSARIRSMEHIDNGQKFCVRQSTWDTGFAGPGQKCLRRWSCVTNPVGWRLGRMKDRISNGSVYMYLWRHYLRSAVQWPRPRPCPRPGLGPGDNCWYACGRRSGTCNVDGGCPTATPLCCKQGDSENECTGDIGGPAGGLFGIGGQHQCVAPSSLPCSRTLLAALSSFRGRESSDFAS